MTPGSFITQIAPLAVSDAKRSGVLASVTIAQACLESAYGSSELAVNACNLFGMQKALSGLSWAGGTYLKPTTEMNTSGKLYSVMADFRKYADWAESVANHSNYLLTAKNGSGLRYAGLAAAKTPRNQLTIIKNGGYATDASYVAKVLAVIARYGLTKYDKGDAMKILIICGHGAGDPGATAFGKQEAELTRLLAPLIKNKLKPYSVAVDIADTNRNWYSYLSGGGSYDFSGYDYVLELHFNALSGESPRDGKAKGTEIFTVRSRAAGAVEKKIIQQIAALGLTNRGTKQSNFTVIYKAQSQGVDAALLEVCFIDDADDMAVYNASPGKVANAIAYGLASGLGIAKAAVTTVAVGVTRYVNNAGGLNLRAGAGTDKRLLKTLTHGTQVTWNGEFTMVGDDRWVKVSADGFEGWVFAGYLKI